MKTKITNVSPPAAPWICAYLARAGVCSRRKAQDLIDLGAVSVNGTIVTEPTVRVNDNDKVYVHGKRITAAPVQHILLHKPKGVLTTCSDPSGAPTVFDVLGSAPKKGLFPVGRLDRNTTGLLLLTTDGQLAQRLAHPRHGARKTYCATLNRLLMPEDAKRLMRGIRLDGRLVRPDQLTIRPSKRGKGCKVIIAVHVGLNRVIRRLFEAVGYFVNDLQRIGFAALNLRGLAPGEFRRLTKFELQKLQR